MSRRILLTEDDTLAGQLFEEVLKDQGYQVDRVETGEAALQRFEASRYDLLLVDVQLPGKSGLDVTRQAKAMRPDVPIVVMTAFASMETAIEAIREGAFDYASKPMNLDELRQVVARALAQSSQTAAVDQQPATESLGTIIGNSPAMVDVYKTVARVAQTRSTVLILGESGTGKELVARAIHQHSPRARRAFMAIDCGALPETLLESELFGYVRGAFTGAILDRKGLFEEADGASCFLDEIGDISPALQAKLLRVLQEGEVRRIGSQKWVKVDVRVIAATNKDLGALVRAGSFREDLYYRLNVVSVQLPPLRDRADDIPALANHFLRRYADEVGKTITGLSDEAVRVLRAYQWPGNIRELENAVERAVTLANHRVLTADDLPLEVRKRPAAQEASQIASTLTGMFADAPTLEEVKKRYIWHVLQQNRGNLSRAAVILDVDRRSLYRMMDRYKLEPPRRES
jgi:two-component system, NtrC family, response regulator AtoC